MRWVSPGKGHFTAALPMARHLQTKPALNRFGQSWERINPTDPAWFHSALTACLPDGQEASRSEVFALLRLHVNKTPRKDCENGAFSAYARSPGWEGDQVFLGKAGQGVCELLGASRTPPGQARAQFPAGTSSKKLPKQVFNRQAGVLHKERCR